MLARAVPDVAGRADANFVRHWGGYLDELEVYERSLESKRAISADCLQAMSQMQFAEGPVFVFALAEAQLSAPPRFTAGGESTLVAPKDFAYVAPGGKGRNKAIRASMLMSSAREFADAYSHVDAVTRRKHISALDCRLVMMVRCQPSRGSEPCSLGGMVGRGRGGSGVEPPGASLAR